MADQALMVKEQRAQKDREKVDRKRADRRRFKTTPVPTGDIRRVVPEKMTRTKFPSKVKKWRPGEAEQIFKDGANNSKIGGDVTVGDLAGAHIVTLSLEERKTCPSSCAMWQTCYGNNLHRARRWEFDEHLLDGMELELMRLCEEHAGVLVRLHVLGDFVSSEYVFWWHQQLIRHRNLLAFGFTAHSHLTRIGRDIAMVRDRMAAPYRIQSRFAIRHSGQGGPWGSFTIDFPTEHARIGDAVVCPEQRDAMNGTDRETHCGSCALCWQSDVPVAFVEH